MERVHFGREFFLAVVGHVPKGKIDFSSVWVVGSVREGPHRERSGEVWAKHGPTFAKNEEDAEVRKRCQIGNNQPRLLLGRSPLGSRLSQPQCSISIINRGCAYILAEAKIWDIPLHYALKLDYLRM